MREREMGILKHFFLFSKRNNSTADNDFTKTELHRQLLALLKNGYLKEEPDITSWREQFREHCADPAIVEGDIKGHFDYLEKTGKIRLGKYDVPRRIFQNFNVIAVDQIDKTLVRINSAPES